MTGLMSNKVTAGFGIGADNGSSIGTTGFLISGFFNKGNGAGAAFLAGGAALTGALAITLAAGFGGALLIGADFTGAAFATAFTGAAFFTELTLAGNALATGAFFLAIGAALTTGLATLATFLRGLAGAPFFMGAAFLTGAL